MIICSWNYTVQQIQNRVIYLINVIADKRKWYKLSKCNTFELETMVINCNGDSFIGTLINYISEFHTDVVRSGQQLTVWTNALNKLYSLCVWPEFLSCCSQRTNCFYVLLLKYFVTLYFVSILDTDQFKYKIIPWSFIYWPIFLQRQHLLRCFFVLVSLITF